MERGPNPPPGRLAPGLRLATWNVNGLSPSCPKRRERIHALAREWVSLRLSIVCVQETHLTPHTATAVEALLRAATDDLHVPPSVLSGRTTTNAGRGLASSSTQPSSTAESSNCYRLPVALLSGPTVLAASWPCI